VKGETINMAKKHGRARAGARAIGKGMLAAAGFLAKRSTLYGVGARIGEKMLEKESDYVKQNWWAGPVAILGTAALLRKNESAAKGLAGAAGYAGAIKYDAAQFQNGKTDQSPIHYWDFAEKKAGAPAAPGVQGYDDADAGLRNDAGLYQN
jgi:hypothetical protein